MKPEIRVLLLDHREEKVFGEGPFRLLRAVEATGSLRAAASSMGMAYTKALRLLRRAEEAVGSPLTVRTIGGDRGGGSTLTPRAVELMERYQAYQEACRTACRQLYSQYFPPCVGCVIMASGEGSRFGGNKLMADFGGAPLIARALDVTEGLFDGRVAVTRHREVEALCRARGIPAVYHQLPHRSDTVRLGLEALGPRQGYLFLPGDQPLLSRESLQTMLRAASEQPEAIIALSAGDRRGAPVLFPHWAREALMALPQGRGGSCLLEQYPERVIPVPAAHPQELEDVDTPHDLDRLLNQLP